MVKIISNLKRLFDLNNYQHDIIADHMKLFTMISMLIFQNRTIQLNSLFLNHFLNLSLSLNISLNLNLKNDVKYP